MTLRKVTSRNKPDLATKPGAVTGSVNLTAKATARANANEWQYSLDGGKTSMNLPTTTRSTTTVQNLTPGTTVAFRQRALTTLGLADWGQPVTTLVT